MKVQDDMVVCHDNGCKLGKIFIDSTFGRVMFRPGKEVGNEWVFGGYLDSKDCEKLSKIMSGIAKSIK